MLNISPQNNCSLACSRYRYDTSFWEETVTTEWDLVCQDSSLNVLAKMIFFSGFAVGTFLAGIVSDIWGRKRWSEKLEVDCKSDSSLLTSDPSCCSPC